MNISKYTENKALRGMNGFSRTFLPETGYVLYRLKRGYTTVGGAFSIVELTNPLMRTNTAKKLRSLRATLD